MKITDSDTIKNSENDLIDSLIGELDWQVIETLLKEKYHLKLHDDVEYKSGDIIVHGQKIAYKLDFDVRVTLSLLVGRDGECFDIKASGGHDEDDIRDIPPANSGHDALFVPADEEAGPMPMPGTRQFQNMKKNEVMASHIIDIINEIND